MYKNIIWDFDGTLFDTYPVMISSFKKALEDENIYDSYEFVEQLIKQSVSQTIGYYKEKHHISDDLIANYLKYEEQSYKSHIKPFNHARDICKDIFNHDKRNFLYTHRDAAANTYIKSHGLDIYFTDSITSDEGFDRKPSPNALNHLINKHHLLKSETLMVGDRVLDIEAAKNAGIKACFFNSELINETFEADYVVNSLDELYTIIGLMERTETVSTYTHYERLIEDDNDPCHDDEGLTTYLNLWTGHEFINYMELTKNSNVLEIGVGTGRLAKRVLARGCKSFVGLDLSPETVKRAEENLKKYDNKRIKVCNIVDYDSDLKFDLIYSVLTFQHIENKKEALKTAISYLKTGGILLLSLDNIKSDFLDYTIHKVKVYFNDVEEIKAYLNEFECELEFVKELVDEDELVATLIKCRKR